MIAWNQLFTMIRPDPLGLALLVVGVLSSIYLYQRSLRSKLYREGAAARGSIYALIAGLLGGLVLCSPIGSLADGQVFSAHMVEHLVLLLGVSMFVVLAFFPNPNQRCSSNLTGWFIVGCWLAGLSAMWAWHQPALCSASIDSYPVAILRDLTLVGAGVLFWLPVFGRNILPGPLAVAYLFTACVGCTMLGAYITFVPISVCPAFQATPPNPFVTSLYQSGFSRELDQKVGGLLMWVPTCTIYVSVSMVVLKRWLHETGEESAEPSWVGRTA